MEKQREQNEIWSMGAPGNKGDTSTHRSGLQVIFCSRTLHYSSRVAVVFAFLLVRILPVFHVLRPMSVWARHQNQASLIWHKSRPSVQCTDKPGKPGALYFFLSIPKKPGRIRDVFGLILMDWACGGCPRVRLAGGSSVLLRIGGGFRAPQGTHTFEVTP